MIINYNEKKLPTHVSTNDLCSFFNAILTEDG